MYHTSGFQLVTVWGYLCKLQYVYILTYCPKPTTYIICLQSNHSPEHFIMDVFLTVHHNIGLSKYQLSAQSLNIQQYKLHYTPQHVSNSTLRIIRRTNLTPQPLVSSLSVSSRTLCGWRAHTVRLLIEGDDTRGCGDTIVPPDDEQRADRNTLRSIM